MVESIANPDLVLWGLSKAPLCHADLTEAWGETVLSHGDDRFDRLCPAALWAFGSVWVVFGIRVDDGTVGEHAVFLGWRRISGVIFSPSRETCTEVLTMMQQDDASLLALSADEKRMNAR